MTQHVFSRRPVRDSSTLPNVIFSLLIANGLVFAAQRFFPPNTLIGLALWPLSTGGFMPWQLVTYAFMHDPSSLAHIGFNMFGLWMFGRDVERALGARRFLIYYFAAVVGAAILQLIVASFQPQPYLVIGASGGVFGVLLAFGMLFPNRMIMLIIPPIPMRAKYFVILYGAFELVAGVTDSMPGIAHFAHLGGMLAGFLLFQFWRNGGRR